TVQPAGASSCTVPAARTRAAVSSTVTGRPAPGAKSRPPAMNRTETGAMTSSRRRSAGWAGFVAGIGSPAITSVCPPTSKTYSSGNVGGFSARPMSAGSATSNIPAVPSVRSQYGWLGGVVAGRIWEASRMTGWFGRSSMALLIARALDGGAVPERSPGNQQGHRAAPEPAGHPRGLPDPAGDHAAEPAVLAAHGGHGWDVRRGGSGAHRPRREPAHVPARVRL